MKNILQNIFYFIVKIAKKRFTNANVTFDVRRVKVDVRCVIEDVRRVTYGVR